MGEINNQSRRNALTQKSSLSYTVRTSKTKVVNQRVGIRYGESMLHTTTKTQSMFQGALRGLEPEATPGPLKS